MITKEQIVELIEGCLDNTCHNVDEKVCECCGCKVSEHGRLANCHTESIYDIQMLASMIGHNIFALINKEGT